MISLSRCMLPYNNCGDVFWPINRKIWFLQWNHHMVPLQKGCYCHIFLIYRIMLLLRADTSVHPYKRLKADSEGFVLKSRPLSIRPLRYKLIDFLFSWHGDCSSFTRCDDSSTGNGKIRSFFHQKERFRFFVERVVVDHLQYTCHKGISTPNCIGNIDRITIDSFDQSIFVNDATDFTQGNKIKPFLGLREEPQCLLRVCFTGNIIEVFIA